MVQNFDPLVTQLTLISTLSLAMLLDISTKTMPEILTPSHQKFCGELSKTEMM